MSIPATQRVIKHSRSSGSARTLMMTLAFMADKDGVAWPKRSTLASAVNVSERQIKNLLSTLKASGELYVREGRGRGNPSEYFVLTGLEEAGITDVLTRRFDLSEEEAKQVLTPGEKGKRSAEKGKQTSPKEKGKSSTEKGKPSAGKGEIQCLFPLPPNDNISNPSTPISTIDRDRQERVRAQNLRIAFAPPPFAPGAVYCPAHNWLPYLVEPSDPLELRYAEDDWQHQFAQAAYKHFDAADVLSPRLRRKAQRDPPGLMDDWATVFRRLAEIDGYDPFGEIQPAMAWLFTPGNRWIEEGMICSAGSLRKKTRTGDRTKFDVILKQAQADERAKRKKKRRPLTDDESERLRQFAREVASAA